MKFLKSREQYMNEDYFSKLGDKLQTAKDNLVTNINNTIADKAKDTISKAMFKAGAKIGGLPKSEMEKFITYIQSNCRGEIVTLEKIKSLVAPMLKFGVGLSADRARDTAVFTDNFNFVDIVSELIYNEMSERNILDCTSGGDDDFSDEETYDDMDDDMDDELSHDEDDMDDDFEDDELSHEDDEDDM